VAGFQTGDVVRAVGRLVGMHLPKQTVERWVERGLVTPSVRRGTQTGLRHEWSAEDVIALAWLADLRAEGTRVSAYALALRQLWRRLPALLGQGGPLFFVTIGRDVTVMRLDELAGLLREPPRRKISLWPVPASVAQVRADLLRERVPAEGGEAGPAGP